MDQSTQQETPAIGTPMRGGFFGGQVVVNERLYNLILAPKALGQTENDMVYLDDGKDIPAKSYNDGLANTKAMADAGSGLAKWALGLNIDGCTDYYIPSQDELEVLYRAFKPTTETNWCYFRSGINLSTPVPTRPYTPAFPPQTSLDAFRKDGREAFDTAWHWSSTQYVAGPSDAWCQHFGYGDQDYDGVSSALRARAVRRELVI